MSQSHKSSQAKDEAGNAALIPGSSAWGALKGGTSQKPLILSSDSSTPNSSSEKTSPKPAASGDKSWPPPSSSVLHINGIVNRWGSGSANGAWADNRDVGSGWGSPDSSPIPNAGTEVWSAQKPSVEGSSVQCWASGDNGAGSVWSDSDTKTSAESDSRSLWAKTSSQPSVWGASTNDAKSPTADHWGGREQSSKWVTASSQAATVMSQSSTLSSWAQAAGRGLPAVAASKSGNSAPGSNMSREELIVRAINSQDGWGQTPIRQDTAWDVTAEPSVTSAACRVVPQAVELAVQPQLPNNNTGTAIWEAAKDTPAVLSSDLGPRALLTSAGQDSIMATLPWVGAESNIGAGWEIPLPVEGSALLSGERCLPAVKCGSNNTAWSTLLDNKDGSVPPVSPWNLAASGGEKVSVEPGLAQTVSGAVDGGASVQCNALAALIDSYKHQSSAGAWDTSALQCDAAAVSSSASWPGSAVGLPVPTLLGSDQRSDIWSQAGVSKPQWASSETSDNAIWNPATQVSLTNFLFCLYQ